MHFVVNADIALMQRMFENLLDNALRPYPRMADGSRSACIGRRKARWVVDVLDTGCGMSAEVAERVFDSCWSGHADDAVRGGLGLAIVARAVELHGGQVSVTSRVGVGSCFHLQLPVGVHDVRSGRQLQA